MVLLLVFQGERWNSALAKDENVSIVYSDDLLRAFRLHKELALMGWFC